MIQSRITSSQVPKSEGPGAPNSQVGLKRDFAIVEAYSSGVFMSAARFGIETGTEMKRPM